MAKNKIRINWKILGISFLFVFLAASLGSFFTASQIPTWYASLIKPNVVPPNWLFGPMWTTLYTLMIISLYLFWTTDSKENKKCGFILNGIQLFLNAIWSVLFFGMHELVLALVCIIFLWFFILFTIIEFKPINKKAAYLLIPYLAWVTAATILNLSIAWLN